ncbi:hypothetical protein LJC07_04820 [Christensenellaceae bacterium OttesenSCG-928-L17]|nr:hypothetical protein [Christensenellaceae bacterium OttesenSCG-928-L17]
MTKQIDELDEIFGNATCYKTEFVGSPEGIKTTRLTIPKGEVAYLKQQILDWHEREMEKIALKIRRDKLLFKWFQRIEEPDGTAKYILHRDVFHGKEDFILPEKIANIILGIDDDVSS